MSHIWMQERDATFDRVVSSCKYTAKRPKYIRKKTYNHICKETYKHMKETLQILVCKGLDDINWHCDATFEPVVSIQQNMFHVQSTTVDSVARKLIQ